MQITSSLKAGHDYVPIWPTPQYGCQIQLKLLDYYLPSISGAVRIIQTLPKLSYLKIDEPYEVPIMSLVERADYWGNHLRIMPKYHGGVVELRRYIRRLEYERNYQPAEEWVHKTELLRQDINNAWKRLFGGPILESCAMAGGMSLAKESSSHLAKV